MVNAMDHVPAPEREELPLGATINLQGHVVGRSEFQGGPSTYLVQYERKGVVAQDWFSVGDFSNMD